MESEPEWLRALRADITDRANAALAAAHATSTSSLPPTLPVRCWMASLKSAAFPVSRLWCCEGNLLRAASACIDGTPRHWRFSRALDSCRWVAASARLDGEFAAVPLSCPRARARAAGRLPQLASVAGFAAVVPLVCIICVSLVPSCSRSHGWAVASRCFGGTPRRRASLVPPCSRSCGLAAASACLSGKPRTAVAPLVCVSLATSCSRSHEVGCCLGVPRWQASRPCF